MERVMIFKIVIWAVAAVLFLVPVLMVSALVVSPNRQYQTNSKYYRFLLDFSTAIALLLCRVKVTVKGAEKLPQDSRLLLVSNHRSKFDPIVTWYAFQEHRLSFVSKPENLRIPIFGRIIRRCCFLPIDRENARNAMSTINAAAKLLESGEVSVGIYPEGTRNYGDGLLPFHNGVFKIAKKAQSPIAVVAVSGTDKIHANWPRRGTEVTVHVLEVFSAEAVSEMKTAQIGARVRELLDEALTAKETKLCGKVSGINL